MLMSNLYVGVSGLQTSQNALNTTAHNLANIGTEGYTRQQVSQGTRIYNTISQTPAIADSQIGLGVAYTKCKQVRSAFLDASYRLENGREQFYQISYKALNEIEDQLQEINGAEFAEALNNLWVSVQEFSKDPTSAVTQNSFVQRSSEFVECAKSVYRGLVSYQDNLNDNIAKIVKEMNKIGDQIDELNKKIVSIEAGGVEHANDLRDTRNSLLDRLGEFGNITYEEDHLGIVTVQFEGTQFVTSDNVHHLGLDTEETGCGYYTPYWEFEAKKYYDLVGVEKLDISGAHIMDLTLPVTTGLNTDVGILRSTLLARGDHQATYHDIADSDDTYYNTMVSQSVMMNVEAEFDQLFNNVVTAINDVMLNAASNPATIARLNGTDYNDDPHKYLMFALEDDIDTLDYAINDKEAGTIYSKYTVLNSKMNDHLLRNPSIFSFVTIDNEADKAAATALKQAFSQEKYTLNPNVTTKINLINYYDALVGQVANTASVDKSISDNQQITVDTISAAREQIVGVSSDEELEFMIQFQNAYNASSRFINVVSEMLEHIINTLGR